MPPAHPVPQRLSTKSCSSSCTAEDRYKFLLEDEDAISDKKLELSYELKEYEKYCEELDKVLEAFVISGMTMLWPMN